MKTYDAIFAGAVLVTLIGVAGAILLRSGDEEAPAVQRRPVAMPQPVEVKTPPPPAPVAQAAPVETPAPAEAEAPVAQAAPTEAPPPQEKTRRELILGSWSGNQFGQFVTLTFHADGTLGVDAPNMPADLQMSMSYTWDSDDRLTFHVSGTGPNGEAFNASSGASIVELTENRLVIIDERMGMEQTFTR